MPLVPMTELLQDAQRRGYAVAGFTFINAETMQAIVHTARDLRSPALLMLGTWEMPLVGARMAAEMARYLSEQVDVPVCLHLDHGPDLELAAECVEAGFSSVMIDASQLEFEGNVALTRQVYELAHPKGISVEGELGAVGRADGLSPEGMAEHSALTDPAAAAEYVERTGVDALALAIGNAHGIYTELPELDFARLAAIRQVVDCPLVLHGGSGTPKDQLRRAIEGGICKVNVASELSRAYLTTLVDQVQSAGGNIWWSRAVVPARDAVAEVVARWMQDSGCAGKA